MRRILLVLLLAISSLPALAFHRAPAKGDRIGVLASGYLADDPGERKAREALARAVRDELRKAGFHAEVIGLTRDELVKGDRRAGHEADYYVELRDAAADGESQLGGGAGGVAGNVGIGAGVDVVTSRATVDVVVYDGGTLEEVDSFRLRSSRTSAELTSISVGYDWLYLWLPLPGRSRYSAAARDIGRQTAEHLAAQAALQDAPPAR